MYCSSCGSGVKNTLSYCNHCGAKLNRADDDGVAEPAGLFPESLVWAIVSVFVIGLGATIGLMAVMKYVLDFNEGLVIAFSLLTFLLMLAIEGVFIRMLVSPRRIAPEVRDTKQLKEQAANELGAAQQRANAAAVTSVTEHTTHALEPSLPKQPRIHE